MEWVTDPQAWIAFVTLAALEIVLGIDNIVFISILVGKLPQNQQAKAYKIGLGLDSCHDLRRGEAAEHHQRACLPAKWRQLWHEHRRDQEGCPGLERPLALQAGQHRAGPDAARMLGRQDPNGFLCLGHGEGDLGRADAASQ